jgi:hypothetical protein
VSDVLSVCVCVCVRVRAWLFVDGALEPWREGNGEGHTWSERETDNEAARVMHNCLTIRSPLRTPKHRPALTAHPVRPLALPCPPPCRPPPPLVIAVRGPHWSCVSAHPPWPCLHTHVGQELCAAAALRGLRLVLLLLPARVRVCVFACVRVLPLMKNPLTTVL